MSRRCRGRPVAAWLPLTAVEAALSPFRMISGDVGNRRRTARGAGISVGPLVRTVRQGAALSIEP